MMGDPRRVDQQLHISREKGRTPHKSPWLWGGGRGVDGCDDLHSRDSAKTMRRTAVLLLKSTAKL